MFFSAKPGSPADQTRRLHAVGRFEAGKAFFAEVRHVAVLISGWFSRDALFRDPSAPL